MKRFRRWALAIAGLAILGTVFAAGAVAAEAPTPVYTEDFENTGNEALLLTGYQGTAAAQNKTYTADSGWLRDCNGWVMTGTSPVPADTRNCFSTYWPTMRNLITSLGTLQGQATPTANHGLVAYTATCGDPTSPSFNKAVICGGANQVQWETKSPIAVAPSHFYNFAVDVAATNCHSNHPIFKFSIVSGATEVSLPSIDGCSKGNGARTFSPSGPILIATNSIGLRLRNGQGSSNGNDGAIDNIRLLDVTPTMTKAFSPTDLHAGMPSTLTFTIENTTELGAKNGWSFTDSLPAGLSVADPANASTTCPSGSVTAAAGSTSIAVSGNLDANQASCTASVDVTSPSAGTFENCAANVTTVGLEPPPCASVTFEAADLALEKTVDIETAALGDQLTYTLQLENKGPSIADSVLLKDTLPPGLSYVSDDAGCNTAALPVLECGLGTLASGESRTVQIVAQVQPSAAGSVQTNVAEASALQPDTEPADNESSAKTAVAPFADLALSKSVSPQVASGPGEAVTYSLVVENKGEGETSATLTDTLPSGLAYLANDSGCDASALPTITCDLGALAKGATATVEIEAEVEPSAAGKVVENTASVSGAAFDPEPENNEASAPLEVEPLSDLAITKTTPATSVKPGDQLTYLLTAENKGPTTESSVAVTDTLPPELEYVSDNGNCDTSALPELKCEVGVQEEGQSKTITLVTKVLATSGTIENTAQVSGINPDAKPANNTSTATTTVEEVSDLAIEKTPSAPAVKPGQQLTYTLAVENKGPSASDPTTVTDTLPPNLTYLSDDGSCDISALPQVSCELGALADGATASVEIVTEVNPDAAGAIENTAAVEGPNPDPTPADNEATATVTVIPLASDLALEKTAPPTAVKAGDLITYTLVAANHGPDPSPQTVLVDELPPQLAYVSDDSGCDTSALPQVRCELGTLAEGETRTLQITTRVAATDGQPIQNKARLSGANPDPELANNPDAAQVPLAPIAAPPTTTPPPPSPPAAKKPKKPTAKKGKPRLTLTKTASSAKARPGAVVAYRITVANRGTAPARRVVVCDHPPAAQRTLRTEPKAKGEAKPCWTLKKLAPGAKRSFTLTAMVAPGSDRGTQRNRATATAANVKGVRADTAAVGVRPLPDSGCPGRPLGSGWLAGIDFLC